MQYTRHDYSLFLSSSKFKGLLRSCVFTDCPFMRDILNVKFNIYFMALLKISVLTVHSLLSVTKYSRVNTRAKVLLEIHVFEKARFHNTTLLAILS